ncbi:MAG: polysaccharide deacetylase family protein [Gammaproteobacteria bacterium]
MIKFFLRCLILLFVLLPLVALFVFIIHTTKYGVTPNITNSPPSEAHSALPGPINPELSKVAYPLPPSIKKLSCNRPKTGLITLWFDDAWLSQYTSGAIQLMNKAGFVGAMSVPTGLVGDPEFMTWDQLRALQANGWETTSHSVTHICDPSAYNAETTAYELLHSKAQLESQGLRTDYFVMPCGYNQYVVPEVVAFAKQHYLLYRRAGEEINSLPVQDPYNVTSFAVTDVTTEDDVRKWVNAASQQKGWLILVFHQIDNRKLRYNIDINMFENILTIVKNSGLPVVLPNQVLQACST